MSYPGIFLTVCCLALASCGRKVPEQPSIQCIPAQVSIGGKQIETVVQWNTRTGEARFLNAASMENQSTGKQGSLIGWVPVVDLQQSLRNLPNSVIPSQASKVPATPAPIPQPTIETDAPKKTKVKKRVPSKV